MEIEKIMLSLGFTKLTVILEFLIVMLIIIGVACFKLTGNINYFLVLLYVVFFLAGMCVVSELNMKMED